MKTYENEVYKMAVAGRSVTVVDSWGCIFRSRLDKDGNILAKSCATRWTIDRAMRQFGLRK